MNARADFTVTKNRNEKNPRGRKSIGRRREMTGAERAKSFRILGKAPRKEQRRWVAICDDDREVASAAYYRHAGAA
jgi:hypothetical protein